MLIDLLAIGSSGFNPQNSFLKPLNQHELSFFGVVSLLRFTLVNLLRNWVVNFNRGRWSVYSGISGQFAPVFPPSPPWTVDKSIQNIREEVSKMIYSILLASQENASQQPFTLEEIKQTTKEALKEFLVPDSSKETGASKKEREQIEHQKAVDARLLEETLKDSKKASKELVQAAKQKNKRK